MNAAKAKKSPAKVKGAVLIMILAVMTVMIILLAGSIAVVYSAHNRASVKYSESQGYYTARSVLDNFFSELSESTEQQDSTNTAIGKYYQLNLKENKVDEKPLCIGRSIELELYKPKVEVKDASGSYLDWFKEYCDSNASSLNAQLKGFDPSIPPSSDLSGDTLYQEAEKYYVNLNTSALALSSDYSTYSNFYNQYSTFTGPVEPGMSADTIIYEIDSLDGFGSGTIDTDGDGNPDTNSQFGKLSDTGASKAWITVQVTERILAMGEGTTYAERFKNGKRSEDHIVAKVTAHVIYDGEEITTTQVWVSSPPPSIDANTGLCSIGGVDTTTAVAAVGDISSLKTSFSELTNNSTFAGNAFFEGSFGMSGTDPHITMTKDNSFFVGDNLVIATNVPVQSELCDGALFYATRAYFRSSGSSFGAPGHQINLVTKQFESHSTTKEFYGNIYAERFDVNTDDFEVSTSGVRSAANTSGVAFSNPNKKINGNVYCNYLGIPSYSVYVEVGADTVTFKVNCDPQTGVPFPEADGRRIENMLASSSNKIVVYDGISLISGTKKVTIKDDANLGGHGSGAQTDLYLNQHETYYVNVGGVSTPCDVFSDWHTTGINELGDKVNNFKTDSDRSFAAKGPGSALTASEYKVEIDWSNTNPTMIEVKAGQMGQELKLDYYADAGSGDWVLDDRYQKNFTLPSGVKLLGSGENTFTLPTHRSIYGSYYYGSTVNGTVASDPSDPLYTFDKDTGMFTVDPDDSKFKTFLSEQSIDTEAILAGVDTEGPVDLAALPAINKISNPVTVASGGGDEVNGISMPSLSRVISSSGYIPSNSNDSSVYFIDARSGDLDIQLGDGTTPNQTVTGTYIVYGDGHVTVTVPGVIGGGDGQKFNLGSTSAPFIFMTEEIYSGKSRTDIVIGEPDPRSTLGGDVTSAPNIDWYVPGDVDTIYIASGGSGVTTLCGYIVAAKTNINILSGINGIQRNTYYYNKKITQIDKYTIFGSIVCASYIGGQQCGVCYIPRESGYVDDGSKPLLNKNGMYRSRS